MAFLSPRFVTLVGGVLTVGTLSGCLARQQADGDADSGAAATGGGGSTSAGPKGINCGRDPSTDVTLCSGSSLCPDQVLEPRSLPGCGFRTTSPPFDLECVCDGHMLCPIGIAETCAEVTSLVSGRTLADICNQVSFGTCVEVGSTIGEGATGGRSGTCDPNCAAECAGVPGCLSICGC
jgi:hypothetical protein